MSIVPQRRTFRSTHIHFPTLLMQMHTTAALHGAFHDSTSEHEASFRLGLPIVNSPSLDWLVGYLCLAGKRRPFHVKISVSDTTTKVTCYQRPRCHDVESIGITRADASHRKSG